MSRSSRSTSGTGEVLELTRMTKKGIQALCRKNKLYQTPELNDVLYLHYQGYRDIECLEEYTGLKCLWLENNAISEIGGLNHQRLLKCLFLNNNLIKKIENLENCPELDTLNLANNHITRIENCGVDVLPVLNTLILSHNYIRTAEQLEEAVNCKMLSVLDLAHNRIEDVLVVKVFSQMPELRVLDLDGNPVVNKIPQYRKTLIIECKNLTHLDRRPVFPRDRACAEAWKRGGYEEERREHLRWNKAERRRIRESVNATLRLRNRGGGDPQVELIPSSSDEDITERSSAPPRELPPTEQPADSVNIEENVQYVEYYDPESIPQPENPREIHKCQVCGRVECNYVHIQSRPPVPKMVVDPEEIMKDSQLLLDGKGESFLSTESKMEGYEMEGNIVNIPNISSIRYEYDVEEDQSEDKQIQPENSDSMKLEEYQDNGNKNKDDLYERAYVDYLDTVDRLLYIESKVEAAKSAHAKYEEVSLSNTTESLPPLVNESNEGNNIQNSELPVENYNIGMPAELSKDTEQSPTINNEEIVHPEVIASSSRAEKIDIKVNEQKTSVEIPQKKVLKVFDKNQILPPSEKKKVRLLIDSDAPENHGKIPTTPIPTRKGRKIDWNRVQNKIKRSKIDKGGEHEDMSDIMADWAWNLLKNEMIPNEEALIDKNVSSLDINTLSSTLNDSSITVYPISESSVVSPISQKMTTTVPLEKFDEESEDAQTAEENAAQIAVEECLAESSDEDDVLVDDSLHRQITTENPAASIREFVTSYDAFLHSIEGKLQDLSIRCQTSCVPPEYLTEEANQSVPTIPVTELCQINTDSEAKDTPNTETPSSSEDPVGTSDLAYVSKEVEPILEANLMTNTESSAINIHSDTPEISINHEIIGDQLDTNPDFTTNTNSNISFESMPNTLGSSHHLQGFYTDQGRRNSEIIQRLLENPLTKKVSAVDICKDLRQTTEEMLQSFKNEKERREQSARETVYNVYAQKEQYEGTLEVIDNELVIVRSMHCKETSIEQTYSKILEKAKARVSAKRSKSLQAGHKKESEGKKIERSKSNKYLTVESYEQTDSAESSDSESSQIESGENATDSDEIFQDSCDIGDYVTEMVDEVSKFSKLNADQENCSKPQEIYQEFSANNPPVEGTLTYNQVSETSIYLDISEDFPVTPYICPISEPSDESEIFEQAHCDLESLDDNLIDIIAENPTPRYEFPEDGSGRITRISTSSCDAVLNTSYETTLSSCWDTKDINQDVKDIITIETSKELCVKQRHSGGIEHLKDTQEELIVSEKLHSSLIVKRQCRENSDSEKEDSESHSVICESGHPEERHTM